MASDLEARDPMANMRDGKTSRGVDKTPLLSFHILPFSSESFLKTFVSLFIIESLSLWLLQTKPVVQ